MVRLLYRFRSSHTFAMICLSPTLVEQLLPLNTSRHDQRTDMAAHEELLEGGNVIEVVDVPAFVYDGYSQV